MKVKRKDHGAVDEPSSEYQFCKLDTINFLVWKICATATGFYGRLAGRLAGCPADEIVLSLEILKLYTGWNIWVFARPALIMLENLPIMLSGITQNFPYYAKVSAIMLKIMITYFSYCMICHKIAK